MHNYKKHLETACVFPEGTVTQASRQQGGLVTMSHSRQRLVQGQG